MTKIRESFILGIFAELHSRTNHICAELESGPTCRVYYCLLRDTMIRNL